VGHIFAGGEETHVHAVLREVVEEVLQHGLVSDLHRPQEYVEPFAGSPVNLQLLGIHALLSGDEDLIFVDERPLAGRLDQPGTEFGMGDGE